MEAAAASKQGNSLLKGILRTLAVAGLFVSLAAWAPFAILFAMCRECGMTVRTSFPVLLTVGFGVSIAGVFIRRRPFVFLISFAATLIGDVAFGSSFFGAMGLGQFFQLLILLPPFLAMPWFLVLLHQISRPPSTRGRRA